MGTTCLTRLVPGSGYESLSLVPSLDASHSSEHITDTLAWLPSKLQMPIPLPADRVYRAAQELTTALLASKSDGSHYIFDTTYNALTTLSDIFSTCAGPPPTEAPIAVPWVLKPIQPPPLILVPPVLAAAPAPRLPKLPAALSPRVVPAPSVPKPSAAPPQRVAPNTPIPPVELPAPVQNTVPEPPTIPNLTWAQRAASAPPSPTLLETPVAPISHRTRQHSQGGRIVFLKQNSSDTGPSLIHH
jgi:hypothetical protein